MAQIIVASSYTNIDREVKEASERSLEGKQVGPRLRCCGGGYLCLSTFVGCTVNDLKREKDSRLKK